MPDDQKDEEITKLQPSDSAAENLPPFVPNDDPANYVALSARARAQMAGRVGFTANAQVLPQQVGKRAVLYVDFGFTSAREYWADVVEPAVARFQDAETRGNAITVSLVVWPLIDWLWHEQHPGEDTRNNKNYGQFQQQIVGARPELAWFRDAADAGKHRGLGRPNVQVREITTRNTQTFKFFLDDGTEHEFADALSLVVEYFRKTHFPA